METDVDVLTFMFKDVLKQMTKKNEFEVKPGTPYFGPAVNRQPSLRRGARRADHTQNATQI